ncbi:hypothetical protein [Maribacter sp. 2-571]|uniref:hypothetical protein n=1 Tax=Maribacter sp. 2-571 TaxID=3417569 RepID=UPI003D324991
METVLRNIITLSVTLHCPYDRAFEYLATPINQKEWAIHFFRDIEEIDGKTIAVLPFGKLPMHIKSDYKTGILDIHLGEGKPIHTRLIEIDSNTNVYNFTLARPKGMPDDVWKNKALPDMQDELNILKRILEEK